MAVKSPAFESEVALCSAFIDAVDKRIWTPYAETAGWDILLARRADGFQIGVQAKLQFNVDVVVQAIEEYGHWSAAAAGPDCRAVLVPAGGIRKLARVCDYIGVIVLSVYPQTSTRHYGHRIEPGLPDRSDSYRGGGSAWHEWAPAERHKLPEYVPDVAAGAPSPLQLTEWKIKAIKIAVMLELRGAVSRRHFGELQIDHRRWIANGWVILGNGGYIRGAMPDFAKQHPKVYEKIKADAAKWMPKQADLLAGINA